MLPRDLGAVSGRPIGLAVAERALEEAAQLDERRVAVLDPQVDDALPALALCRDDDDPRAASPAPVATRRLGGVERRQQAQGERAGGRLERLAHRLPHARRLDHVRLRDPALPGGAAGRRNAVRARPLARPPVGGHHPHLPEVRQLVVGAQSGESVRGRRAAGHQLEPAPAVAAVGKRLSRDRADAGPGPRHRGAGVERL